MSHSYALLALILITLSFLPCSKPSALSAATTEEATSTAENYATSTSEQLTSFSDTITDTMLSTKISTTDTLPLTTDTLPITTYTATLPMTTPNGEIQQTSSLLHTTEIVSISLSDLPKSTDASTSAHITDATHSTEGINRSTSIADGIGTYPSSEATTSHSTGSTENFTYEYTTDNPSTVDLNVTTDSEGVTPPSPQGLSDGEVAAIVICSLAAVCAIAGGAFFLYRKRNEDAAERHDLSFPEGQTPYHYDNDTYDRQIGADMFADPSNLTSFKLEQATEM